MPTLRIVIAVHNEEAHLPEQLSAIDAQMDPDVHMICVDDASSDATADIIFARWQSGMTGLTQMIRNFRRRGVHHSFNLGADAVGDASEWLMLLSGNDVLQPGCVAAWRRALERFPDCRLVCGDIERQTAPPKLAEPELRTVVPGEPHVPGPGVFIRRDMWQQYGGYNPGLGPLADWYLNHLIALRHGFVYLRQPMAWERPHANRQGEVLRNPEVTAQIAAELLRLWRRPENADIRPAWLASGLAAAAATSLGATCLLE